MAFENLHTKYQAKAYDLPPAAELAAMADAGMTYQEIADEFGCSESTIGGRLTAAGLNARDRRPTKTTEPASTPGSVSDAEDGEAATSAVSSASKLPLLGLGQMPDWMDKSPCSETDPEAFFPDKGESTRHAKAICGSCRVAAECLDYALANDERFGVWGGLSERERRAIKKAMTPDLVACGRDGCDRTFATEADRNRHQGNTHDRAQDTHACPACDYTSAVVQGVTLHIRHQHPDLNRTAS